MLPHSEGRHLTRVARRTGKRLRPAVLGSAVTLAFLPLLGVTSAQAAVGQVTEFPLTQGANSVLPSSGMTLGSDGNLYFGSTIETSTSTSQPAISRITPSGQVTTFTVPQGNIGLTALGPDKNVWFARNGATAPGELGSITPAGQITTFSIPSFAGQPNIIIEGIAAGSDGNMWFTANAGTFRGLRASAFGEVNPATGAVKEFPIPATSTGTPLPGTPILGSDGNIWTTLGNGNDVIRASTS